VCDNAEVLQLDPSSPEDLTFALKRAVKQSGLSLAQICQRLETDYGVELTVSGLSHVINRGTIRLQRALQILAICGVKALGIEMTHRAK
jgi:hypothetical protein